jgi:hypothetical protein
LKNAGATYQRAIQACFKRQLNKNVEAYVDDVVVKTKNSNTLIADLEETFASLREYRWKLNPKKCVFGVPSGKLLGFIISHRGIEANPEKISAITSMKAPTCIKDVHKLTGCMAALNSYIVTDYPTTSSQTWAPISTMTSSRSTARTAGSTSDMSQLPILGPTDKSSAPMGWCSTLSRSSYMTLPTPKEASGSRNYPMRSGGYVLNPLSQRDNRHTS